MSGAKLYSGTKNASSWAMRAWLALREAGFPFEEEVVDIRRPQRFGNLDKIRRFSPPAMVPVLTVSGTVIYDSLAIMEFANEHAGGRLFPDDPISRARARAVGAWQHSGLSNICSRISFESAFYPCKRTLTSGEQSEAARLFDHLEALLVEAGGPYLFGEVSLADLALVPAVVRLTRHGALDERWQLASAWCGELLARPSVAEWMDEADRLPHIWFDGYLIPGAAIDLHAAERQLASG